MGRASIRSKASRLPTTTATTTTSAPKSAKKAARLTRHTSFVSRIEKSAPKSSSARSRRRKKASTLVASLESLADALPDDEITQSVNFTSGSSKAGNGVAAAQKGSMKSRPGAMKRKGKLVKSECERFGRNLAIIETAKAAAGQQEGTGKTSWEMLRGFIGATLERKEEFVEKDNK